MADAALPLASDVLALGPRGRLVELGWAWLAHGFGDLALALLWRSRPGALLWRRARWGIAKIGDLQERAAWGAGCGTGGKEEKSHRNLHATHATRSEPCDAHDLLTR